jgi:hypothetical protein
MCSCGKDTTQIVAFQNKLYNVVADIEVLHNDLNNLDVTASDAADTALKKLGKLDDAFKKLSKIDVVDEEYAYITDLAKEGSEYMTQAYDLFKEAYADDNFDEENADLAYKYLERATTRIRVIVTMLHGEIPDGVIVH